MINSVCWRGLAVDIIRRLWDHGYWRDNETLQRIHDEWLHFWVDYRTEKTMEDVDRQIKELQQEPEIEKPLYWEQGDTIGFSYDFTDDDT